MRPLYLLLRIFLPYPLFLFYRKTKTLNSQKKFNAQTIFVSNHPSAFIDPLVAASLQMPVVYFVTRGDIFKKWLHPITWASHMVPIFRKAQDGADSHKKNEDSFSYLKQVLLRKKSLILFGEGYTDDVFIRSLKPLKKGPARIAFDTMEETNWSIDLKIQALGINYTHPKHFRSDVLVAFSDCIRVADYKELHAENPMRAITELTRDIQQALQDQITYVEQKDLAPFVENLLILSRKGMNNFHRDGRAKLEDRYRYSQQVAHKVNAEFSEEKTDWKTLKEGCTTYFNQLKKTNVNENWVAFYNKNQNKGLAMRYLWLILGFPFALVGLVHNFLPYILLKRFVEGTFKRDVFWSGVKMTVGWVFGALYNLPFIFLFHAYIIDNYWLAIAYYLTVPAFTGLIAYNYVKLWKDTAKIQKVSTEKLNTLNQERKALKNQMAALDLL